MPWPVYSERFIAATNTVNWTYYTVPTGHRVVATSVLMCGDGTNACSFYVAAGIYVPIAVSVPAAEQSRAFSCRLVCYAGEQLGGAMSRTGASIVISGYLFKNAPATSDEPPEQAEGPPPANWVGVGQLPRDIPAGIGDRHGGVQRGVRRWGLVAHAAE